MAGDVNTWSLTAGLARKLTEEFGADAVIYADSIPQDFRTPSFYVRQISGGFTALRGWRYRLDAVVMLTYFPEDHANEEQKEILGVLSQLYPAVEYIAGEDGVPVRAESMSHEITDHELHMTLSYSLCVFRRYDRGAKMQVLHQIQHVKETGNGK